MVINPDDYEALGVFEAEGFPEKLAHFLPDEELRERFMAALTFVLGHDPLQGHVTERPGVLAICSQGEEFGFSPPVVVYYSFDAINVTLEDVDASH